ncbi:gp205 [Sphingomonas phage PAU]|uniref:gp205 n=1 Tax=Sphingomonas phage PAU TaxID=1150991 RepID=UPI000257336B|nr:gp205 [Sphingomonas phage PAU]AFF28203.1 gp205 [Sphingomonas phage PAU]
MEDITKHANLITSITLVLAWVICIVSVLTIGFMNDKISGKSLIIIILIGLMTALLMIGIKYVFNEMSAIIFKLNQELKEFKQ